MKITAGPLANGIGMAALRRLPPEIAHRTAISALKAGVGGMLPRSAPDPALATEIAGLKVRNPVGLAAGFDKNGEVAGQMLDLGFGFVEIGTVTPRPQDGNPRPRLFRLAGDDALINRMGFNNDGAEAVAARLAALRSRRPTLPGPVGVNLGCNRDSDDPIADYRVGVDRFADLADYLVVNISSPNTPGLRDLQAVDSLRRLLLAVVDRRDAACRRVPVFVKVAPDLSNSALDAMAAPMMESGIDGVMATNTTVGRPDGLRSAERAEAGGLSGRPLAALAEKAQARLCAALQDRLPVIGVGGIGSGRDAYGRVTAGATAVQLYSALVFQGPGLVKTVLDDLSSTLKAEGYSSIRYAVGSRWQAVDAA